ncbi:hypothetical protein OEZ85_008021 [Tetradesmus obliquus]|uniref:Uncharacterized protein n=1 Tax=Tetradesmus obliquus TaxID=3088 RepID=A0ABY8THZ0_TETOB|nr:hypothetical protein OEZ85_008021 [Tetradesmus obliquus]
MVWLGPFSSPALTHLQLTYSARPWLLLDPASCSAEQGLLPELQRLLKRRYYMVERARGASMVGLLVGTLGAAGYLEALTRVRQLAAAAGKKTYTLLMGKPSPAKLANFPEIEVFVMLADPQGLILDSKEYLSPIITPHEAFLAFTGRAFDAASYRLDFGDLLTGEGVAGSSGATAAAAAAAAAAGARVGGNVSGQQSDSEDAEEEEGGWGAAAGVLVVAGSSQPGKVLAGAGSRSGQQVQVHSAAQYLQQHRTYKGLETPATGGEILAAEAAVPGRSGRAAGYSDEPTA